VQEGASWVVDRLTRQVDDLAAALGGRYAVAATESLPPERGWFRTGCYVLYRTDLYEPVGGGGHFDLGTLPGGGERWAAYQALRSKSTGATFLVVSPHLYVNGGSTADDVRRAETATMVTLANKLAATLGRIPVVYAGDFNSHEGHAVDGPAIAARAAGLADSLLVAPSLADAQYNSANQYLRTPPAAGLSIDHIYASPGVAVTAWRQVLRLRNGTFDGVLASDHNPVIADVAVPYAARL
jgi:endonuclease/exonuclease/phosphatase family metal-dependent hydrolase